jgi:hypothetical protein
LNKQYSREDYHSLVPRIIEQMKTLPYRDEKGRSYQYGEYFPPEMAPFAYNESIAQQYLPLSKAGVVERGYRWRDQEQRNYQITLPAASLPDNIKDVPDSIVNEMIGCMHSDPKNPTRGEPAEPSQSISRPEPAEGCNEQCTTAFKIIKDELQFYRRMNLPLPRLCPNCRHYQRLKQRNPLKLWHRRCMCMGMTNGQQPTTNGQQRAAYQYQNTAKHFHGDQPCPIEFETSYSPDRKEIVYCERCYNSEVA